MAKSPGVLGDVTECFIMHVAEGRPVTDVQRVRLVALVAAIAGDRRAVHTAGYPLDPKKLLPMPDVVLLQAGDGPGAMLYRYTARGDFAGDTWHESVAAAKEAALYEYRDSLARWVEVPADAADAHAYAIQCAAAVREA
jgi:hypothetical protein